MTRPAIANIDKATTKAVGEGSSIWCDTKTMGSDCHRHQPSKISRNASTVSDVSSKNEYLVLLHEGIQQQPILYRPRAEYGPRRV